MCLGGRKCIGEVLAEVFALHEYRIFTSTRNLKKMTDLVEKGVKIPELDVTQDEDILQVVETALVKTTWLDIVVNRVEVA